MTRNYASAPGRRLSTRPLRATIVNVLYSRAFRPVLIDLYQSRKQAQGRQGGLMQVKRAARHASTMKNVINRS